MKTAGRGSTLIELVVTLTIMGIVTAVVTLSLHNQRPSMPAPGAAIANARREALAKRRPVTIELAQEDTAVLVTALPDGEVLADSALHLNRLTGERDDPAR